MRFRFAFLLPAIVFLVNGAAAGQGIPSNLQTGDLVLSAGTCRGGFEPVTGAALPGIRAPSLSETPAPALVLSAGDAVHVPVGGAALLWCEARMPSNVQAGDLVLSSPGCRGGFEALAVDEYPGIDYAAISGPPLAAGTAGTAPVFPPAGYAWCRLDGPPSNLQARDLVPRAVCRDWAAAEIAPVVRTAGVRSDGTTYTVTPMADMPVLVSGRLWCVN